MDTQRLYERIADFTNALARLEEAVRHQPQDDFIRDAIIQRFEFTYEMAWKTLKLLLEKDKIDVRSPRTVFAEALTLDYIQDGSAWSKMVKHRNLTTHTYDEALAKQVEDFIRSEAVALFTALQTNIGGKVAGS